MTALPTIVSMFLLVCIFLLGILALRQGSRTRTLQSELEHLKKELQLSRELAEQQKAKLAQRSSLDTVKDEFISTVSHELRTPLTSIRGALGLLNSGMLGDIDPKAQNLLRIASTNTERLIRLISDILDLERMESGAAPLNMRRCSIVELAHEAIDAIMPMADDAGIRLELASTAPQREAAYFDADPDRIVQVLTNLLSNAIKFSPAGSAVQVQIHTDVNSLLIKVIDRGRGIPSDKLEAIFDRFQQVESADASKKGGTGLGLAICRSIVTQHGGAIWAQPNQNGPGTTLWVQLSRSARASDGTSPEIAASAAERGEGLVLICDDDPGIRVVVAEQLRQHGYDILEAGSGEEAITAAREQTARAAGLRSDAGHSTQPIAAILLDLYMPDLSGWETLEHLRASPATASIPVIILSVSPPTERTLPQGSAQGWVQKPFNENLLLAELKRVLRSSGGAGQVLLVEQDAETARTILTGLRDAGVRAMHAATLQQAVDRCMMGPPDLLILDTMLPDGDGFSLVDWMRRQLSLRDLPVVVYSARELSEADMHRLHLGPTQFLNKTRIRPKQVEDLVLMMVQRRPDTAAVA